MESICLGVYLSGYSENYGIRYNDTGCIDINGSQNNFTVATAGAVCPTKVAIMSNVNSGDD